MHRNNFMKYLFIKPIVSVYSNVIFPGIPSLIGILESIGVECNYINLNFEYNDYLTKEEIIKHYNLLNNFYKTKEYLKYPSIFIPNFEKKIKKYLKSLNWLKKNIDNFSFCKRLLKHPKYISSYDLYNYSLSFYMDIRALSLLLFCYFDFTKNFSINTEDLLFLFECPLNNFKEFYEQQVDLIVEQAPDIIGIQVTQAGDILSSLYLAYLIKKKDKKIHINIGGNYFEECRHRIKNLKDLFEIFFDSISIGDSTKTAVELTKYVNNEISIEEVSNLLYVKNGELKFNEIKKYSSLNNLPFQSFTGYKKEDVLFPEYVLPIRATTTNSCYWGKCIFCTCSANDEPYRIMSVKRFTDEIEYLSKKYNTKYFMFWDNALPPKYLEKVADILIEKKLNIKYSLYARLEKEFTLEVLKKMKKSGCFLIHWGIDSASKSLAKYINKGIDIEAAKEVLKNSHNAGIYSFVYLIMGLPAETIEDVKENIDFIKKNKRNIDVLCIMPECLFLEGSIINDNYEYYRSKINQNEDYINERKKLLEDIYKLYPDYTSYTQHGYSFILKYGILMYKILRRKKFYLRDNQNTFLKKLINIYHKTIYLKLWFLNHTIKR